MDLLTFILSSAPLKDRNTGKRNVHPGIFAMFCNGCPVKTAGYELTVVCKDSLSSVPLLKFNLQSYPPEKSNRNGHSTCIPFTVLSSQGEKPHDLYSEGYESTSLFCSGLVISPFSQNPPL